jgi:hypothetical protein
LQDWLEDIRLICVMKGKPMDEKDKQMVAGLERSMALHRREDKGHHGGLNHQQQQLFVTLEQAIQRYREVGARHQPSFEKAP